MTRILKGDGQADRVARIIPGEVFDARAEAERILGEAHRRAATLALGAEADREEARRVGRAEGREEGLATVTELLCRARRDVARRSEEAENDLLRLSVRIAEKLLGRELAADPSAIADVVRTALRGARSRRELVVRVHPGDAAQVAAARPRLAEALVRHGELSIQADPAVSPGGCQIDTEAGTIDARLEVQLAAIERALCDEPDPR